MISTQSTFKAYNIDCPTAFFEIRSISNIAPTIAELVDSNCIFIVKPIYSILLLDLLQLEDCLVHLI